MTDLNVIDRSVFDGLYEAVGSDMDFLNELLVEFFDDSPQQIANMRAGLAAGNAEDLRRAVHSMKSNAANFGAMTLSGLCKTLEDQAKNGVLDGAGDQIDQIAAEYAKAQAALETLQKGG